MNFLKSLTGFLKPKEVTRPVQLAPETVVRLPKTYEIDETYPLCSSDPDLPLISLDTFQSAFRNNYDPTVNTVVESGTGIKGLACVASRQALAHGIKVVLIAPSIEQALVTERELCDIWGLGDIVVNTGDNQLDDKNKIIITTLETYISAVRQQQTWFRKRLLIIDEGDNKISLDRSVGIEGAFTLHTQKGGKVLLIADDIPNKAVWSVYLRADLFISCLAKAKDRAQVHLIPADYPEVADPDLPQFKLLNGVQHYFRDFYNPLMNCVVQSGTGTGKSVLEYIASQYFLNACERVILILPTKALARDQEKMAYAVWGSGVVARNTGEDKYDQKLASKNFIISTAEGYISAVRKQKEWTTAKLMIFDEGHNLMGDRGGVFDAAITLHTQAGGRVLLMSGTLPNKEALAKHYNADLFVSQFVKTKLNEDPEIDCSDDIEAKQAPAKLPLGTVATLNGYVYRRNSTRIKMLKDKLAEFEGKSILIFVPTKAVGYCLAESLVCPFHSADLDEVERNRIEDEFKVEGGSIKTLIATNTLAEGVNTAADVVIICGTRSGGGKNYLDLNAVKQMFGRAGRGKAAAHAYIMGDIIERAHAKKSYVVNSLPLPVEMMVLTLLSVHARLKRDLVSVLGATFAASTVTQEKISHALDTYLNYLVSYKILKFSEAEEKYSLTAEGSLIARYFITPKDYFAFMKVARMLMKVPATKPAYPAPISEGHISQPAIEPECQSSSADPAVPTVSLRLEEKGCILISLILGQMAARDCPPKIVKELKLKLIPLELEELVNVQRAGLLMHYIARPAALTPFFKFQYLEVSRWGSMFKDLVKHNVHSEAIAKAEINTAMKLLKTSVTTYEDLCMRKAEAQKKAGLKQAREQRQAQANLLQPKISETKQSTAISFTLLQEDEVREGMAA